MREKKSLSVRAEEFLSGKGFYIVLFVCVAVIGVSAWLLLFSQYSPLVPGDAGDYLDAMGETGAPQPGEDPAPGNAGEADTREPGGQPEHQAPSMEDLPQTLNDPAEDALTVQDEPKGGDKPREDAPEDGEDTDVQDPKDMTFLWPVTGEIAAAHSPAALVYDRTMGDWRTHDGIDITARLGTKVLSAANGTVTEIYEDPAYGTTVVIDHGAGLTGTYANLAATPTVKVGDAVTAGSVIGSVGNTALYESGETAHLHLSMKLEGESVDPAAYLPRK